MSTISVTIKYHNKKECEHFEKWNAYKDRHFTMLNTLKNGTPIKVDFSFFLMFIRYWWPIIAYGMPSIYTIAKCGGFFTILYIIMHFLLYQIRHVLFEDKILKKYIYCSSPQFHGPYQIFIQAFSLQGSKSNWLKIVKHFLWFEMFTYN
jgi:hypothetical protein